VCYCSFDLSYTYTMWKNMTDFFSRTVGRLLDIVAPERKDFGIIKKLDAESIATLPKPEPIEDSPWVTALFRYKHPAVRAIIWELKYRGTTLPLEHIGKLLYEEMLAAMSDILLFEHEAQFLLIPIPISTERRYERGYNQSEYIARNIVAHDTEHMLLYAPQWFEKIRDTQSQSHSQSRAERLQNLAGCFNVTEHGLPHVAGAHVFLVDDVVTTGTTLTEARRTLLAASARDVTAFTIAH